MRQAQLVKAGRIEFFDDAAMDGVSGRAQQCADQHVCRFAGCLFDDAGIDIVSKFQFTIGDNGKLPLPEEIT